MCITDITFKDVWEINYRTFFVQNNSQNTNTVQINMNKDTGCCQDFITYVTLLQLKVGCCNLNALHQAV